MLNIKAKINADIFFGKSMFFVSLNQIIYFKNLLLPTCVLNGAVKVKKIYPEKMKVCKKLIFK